MKIRSGFVSNSSSSSFVIFGKIFTRGAFAKRFKFTKEEMKIIVEDGMTDDLEKTMGGLECLPLDEDFREFLVGSTLKGDSTEIADTTTHMDKIFGAGCKIHSGTDNYGILTLDEC